MNELDLPSCVARSAEGDQDVAPLAPILKGLGGPEMTSVREGFAAPASQGSGSVVVAVIDTGITDQKRTDGWLAAVARDPDGVDPLEDGADVVNLSLGSQTRDDLPPVAMTAALEVIAERAHATGRDPLLVAAAGDYGDTRPCGPATFRRVVSVAGLTARHDPAAWSSHGFWVDRSTVAEGIVSTYVEGQESPELDTQPEVYGPDPWALWSGTSFAAPQVAGVVARLRANGSPSVRQSLADLLGQGRALPGYGSAVGILPGT